MSMCSTVVSASRDLVMSRILSSCGSKRNCAEWLRWGAINHQLQVDAIVWELDKVTLIKLTDEFADEIGGVFGTDSEANNCPGISQNGVADIRRKLEHVLMGDRKRDAVLPQF